jgi:hypothetical protein
MQLSQVVLPRYPEVLLAQGTSLYIMQYIGFST